VCLRRTASLLPLHCRPFSRTATDLECVEDMSTTQTPRSRPCSGHGLEITALISHHQPIRKSADTVTDGQRMNAATTAASATARPTRNRSLARCAPTDRRTRPGGCTANEYGSTGSGRRSRSSKCGGSGQNAVWASAGFTSRGPRRGEQEALALDHRRPRLGVDGVGRALWFRCPLGVER
jgi:hypothetical protein